jgi:hypothetical protein
LTKIFLQIHQAEFDCQLSLLDVGLILIFLDFKIFLGIGQVCHGTVVLNLLLV